MAEEALRLLDAEPDVRHLLPGRVAQVVERDALGDRHPRAGRVLLEDPLDARVVQPRAPALERQAKEQRGRGHGRTYPQPVEERAARVGGERQDLLLAALAPHDDRRALGVGEVDDPLDVQPDHLADPEPHQAQLGHRPVAQHPRRLPLERGPEPGDLVLGPPAVHAAGAARGPEVLRDGERPPLLPAQPLVELPHGGDAAGPRGDRQAGLGHQPGEADEVLRGRLREAAPDVLGEVLEVADVGQPRVRRPAGPLEVGPPLEEQGMRGGHR